MVRRLMIVISRMGAILLAASMVSACAAPGLLLPAATATGAPTAAQLQPPTATRTPTATPAPPPPSTTAPASGVRSTLDRLLGEHVLLVGFATGAALDGRADEFAAYAAALDANSVDLASVIASVYGEPAGVAFLQLWREHITMVVNYTQGIGSGDTAGAGQAVQELLNYTFTLGDFLEEANPFLRSDDMANLVEGHILSLKSMIDAQAAGDPATAVTAQRQAYSHMDAISAALAAGIAEQFPETLGGAAIGPAADLRARLNQLLQEHVGLAAAATGAALGGRTAEFEASAGGLGANGGELAAAFTLLYGDAVGAEFLEGWQDHIGIVVNYTTAVAEGDAGQADLARLEMIAYAGEFGVLMNKLHPSLGISPVTELFKMHLLGLQDIIDAQASGDYAAVAAAVRIGLGHMALIADPFAEAFVQQAPDKFQ